MILNCPSCSAKFMVSSEALGEKGRTVKCGKCSHSWFQEAARDSLDDLQKLVDNIQGGADGVTNTPEVPDMPRAAESSGQEIKLERTPKEHAATSNAKEKNKSNQTKTLQNIFGSYDREVAGFMSALAIVAVLVWIIVSIAHAWFEPKPSEFMLDQIKFETSEQSLDGTFRIINLSEQEQSLPAFKVFLLANNDRIVSTQNVKPEHETMKGESEITIPFSFRAPPSVAAKIKVTSVE